MYLKRLKISNYKSFFEPKEFSFQPGFNVLLGANSSGKSSVLEAIAFHQWENTPHRSILNLVDVDTPLSGSPTTELQFSFELDELVRYVNQGQALYITLGEQLSIFDGLDSEGLKSAFAHKELLVDIKRDHLQGYMMRVCFDPTSAPWRNLGGGSPSMPMLEISNDLTSRMQIANFSVGPNDLQQIKDRIHPKIYRFTSERAVRHLFGHHPDAELLPDSSNLAYCINHLQTNNKELFEELNELLHRVFPTIHWVGAPPNGQSQFELRVHTNPSSIKRGDLAVPINRVGTGVGNALAMLYVALTAQTPRFILLEEPNSFLHPRALRELLAILEEIGGQHQFFVTTHSSDVLRTIKASSVTLLEYDGQQTIVRQSDGTSLHELQAGLIDIGISLTDLHGCDRVFWVEGETEEAIFPFLLRKFFPQHAQGIAVLKLHATGDFEARKYRADKVAKIYKKLSQGSFLAPPMVSIALDRESKSNSEIDKITRESDGIIHFLPKVMIEDYLLNPDAIASVLSTSIQSNVPSSDIAGLISDATNSGTCLLNPSNPNSVALHSAKVLAFIFSKYGEIEYHKTKHGPQIVEWLLNNQPHELSELREWFAHILRD